MVEINLIRSLRGRCASVGFRNWSVAAVLLFPLLAQASPEEPAPLAVSVSYSADLFRNVSGGLEVGGDYLDSLELGLDVDGEAALGVQGLAMHVRGIYGSGGTFSERYSGDAMTVSNIESPQGFSLLEAWLDWQPAGSPAASLRVGLYDLNSEFDASEPRGAFLNSAFGIGHEIAQTGNNGPSIFPVTSLGARLQLQLGEATTLRAAVLDGDPGAYDAGWDERFDLGGGGGALIVAELDHGEDGGLRSAAGLWGYTREFEELDADPAASDGPRKSSSRGAYALVEGPLWSAAGGTGRRLDAFLRVGVSSDSVNEFAGSIQSGLVWSQPFVTSRAEHLAMGVIRSQSSDAFRNARRLEGLPTASAETVWELTYRLQVAPWLALQPNFQYVRRPYADPTVDDALVVGLRLELQLPGDP